MARVLHLVVLLALLVSGTGPGRALAQDHGAVEVSGEVEDLERPVPDYDNRGDEPTTAGEVALWVPRIVFSPLYLVSEFVVRRPLGALVTWAEVEDLPTLLLDFFTFGPERKAGIVPTALIDFGFRPSVGIYAFGDDFLFDENDLRLHAATWGPDWLSLTVTDRVEVREDDAWLAFRFVGERRSDWVFFGLGPLSDEDDESRFQKTELGGSALFEADVWRASSVVWEAGVRDVSFGDEACCSDPSISQEFSELPPGWGGYTSLFQRMELAFDTRLERPAAGTGIRISAAGEHAFDLREPLESRWIRYGGNLGLYWDPGGYNRVIRLTLTALFADPVSREEVPFTEQVQLGGTEYMRGYLEGRLIGRSAAVATLEYRWPVWIWLDGTMHAAVGNVFGEHLDGFEWDLLRLSFGLGLRTVDTRDHSFDLLLAFGSEPFDRFEISSVRFLLGTTRGF